MIKGLDDLEAAISAGFGCAADPGKDAKGNEKPPKLPPMTQVEAYIRTLPEYRQRYAEIRDCEETWSTVHAAFEAATARRTLISALLKQGDNSVPSVKTKRRRIVHSETDLVVEADEAETTRPKKRTSPPPVPMIKG